MSTSFAGFEFSPPAAGMLCFVFQESQRKEMTHHHAWGSVMVMSASQTAWCEV